MAFYPNNKKDDPAEFEDVYAGPGMMDEIDTPEGPEQEPEAPISPKKRPDPDRGPIRCVYAGPEYFAKRNHPEEPVFEAVYAGPDMMDGTESPDDPDSPEPDDTQTEEMNGEESGPEEEKRPEAAGGETPYPNQDMRGPDPNQFMTVYAGPQYFTDYSLNSPIGAFAPQPMTPEPRKTCPQCGYSAKAKDNFCTKCGFRFPKDFCPQCGAKLFEGAKFCTECGAKL